MANLSNIIPPVSLSNATGTLPVTNGGTGSSSLTANNVLLGNGTSALQTVAPGASGNILTSNGTTWTSAALPPVGPTLTAVASGSLSDGSSVVINSNGTVSVVAAIAQSFGTPTVFSSANTENVSAVYDSLNQRVVVAYRNNGNSSFPTAVVGTVSGTSISFGTPVVIQSAATDPVSAVYDSVNQKVVVFYMTTVGRAAVGTVSGTSISFGTPTSFSSSTAYRFSSAYDSANQRVVIAYQDDASSSYGAASVGTVSGTSISFGTRVLFRSNFLFNTTATVYDPVAQRIVIMYNSGGGSAIVGTVSGTSISFGTAVVFDSGGASFISAAYDVNAQKVVIAYTDSDNSSFGTGIVGTVSGTTISFGTPTVFESASTDAISAVYDASIQKVVIAYTDGGNSNFGTAVVGTISGTSISFTTPFVFRSGNTFSNSAVYNSNAQRVVISYRDNSNSFFGTSGVYTSPSTNLTSGNFIGFSNAAYTNGQTATIQLVGSVDDAQSGLTSGRAYFVQNNGTLGLTPGTPSVFAGTAVSATRIIVKG